MSFARKSLRTSGIAAAAVLVFATVSTASAVTPPIGSAVFTTDNYPNGVASVDYPTCATTDTSPTEPTPPAITVNTPASVSHQASGTVTTSANINDITTLSASTKATAKMTATATYPKAINATFSGVAKRTLAAGFSTSSCHSSIAATVAVDASVSLAAPGLVTLTAHSNGSGLAEAIIGDQAGSQISGLVTEHPGATATETIFLPAGTYMTEILGGTDLASSTKAASASGTSSATIAFVRGGSRLSGPSGNGAGRYVVLGARTCATHTVASHLVLNRKLVSQIQTVSVLGNGALLKRVTRPAAGRSLTVKVPDAKNEAVRVNVVLRSGKQLFLTASYLRCA